MLPEAKLDSDLEAEFRAIPLTGHPNEVMLISCLPFLGPLFHLLIFSHLLIALYFLTSIPQDIVWYHTPSKTVIEADALFNLVSPDQRSFTPIPDYFLRNMSPNTMFHRAAVSAFSKAKGQSEEFTRAAREIAALDMKRLIPCHGEVLEGPAANQGWRDAYRNFLAANDKRSD